AGGGEACRQRAERVAHRLVRQRDEHAPTGLALRALVLRGAEHFPAGRAPSPPGRPLHQPSDEVGDLLRSNLRKPSLRSEVPQRIVLEQSPVLVPRLLPIAATPGALIPLDPLARVLVQCDLAPAGQTRCARLRTRGCAWPPGLPP